MISTNHKFKFNIFNFLIISIFLSFFGTYLNAKDISSVPAAGPVGDAEFQLDVPCDQVILRARPVNQELVVGEPLVVEFQLEGNVSLIETAFETQLMVGSDIEVFIQPPRGAAYQLQYDNVQPFGFRTVFRLSMHETAEKYVMLGYDRDTVLGGLFDVAGTYQILIRYQCNEKAGGEWLNIAQFPIEVRLGDENPDDSTARTILGDFPESFQSIQALNIVDDSHRYLLEQVYEKTKTAKLWPYAAFILAEEKRMSGNPENLREAEQIFETIAKDFRGHYLQYFAAISHIRCLRSLGEENWKDVFFEYYQDPYITRRILAGDPNYKSIFGEKPAYTVSEWHIFQNPRDGFIDEEKEMQDFRREMVEANLHKEKQIEILIWNDFDVE